MNIDNKIYTSRDSYWTQRLLIEKAEGSNPATSFPLDYKSSNDNSYMTK